MSKEKINDIQNILKKIDHSILKSKYENIKNLNEEFKKLMEKFIYFISNLKENDIEEENLIHIKILLETILKNIENYLVINQNSQDLDDNGKEFYNRLSKEILKNYNQSLVQNFNKEVKDAYNNLLLNSKYPWYYYFNLEYIKEKDKENIKILKLTKNIYNLFNFVVKNIDVKRFLYIKDINKINRISQYANNIKTKAGKKDDIKKFVDELLNYNYDEGKNIEESRKKRIEKLNNINKLIIKDITLEKELNLLVDTIFKYEEFKKLIYVNISKNNESLPIDLINILKNKLNIEYKESQDNYIYIKDFLYHTLEYLSNPQNKNIQNIIPVLINIIYNINDLTTINKYIVGNEVYNNNLSTLINDQKSDKIYTVLKIRLNTQDKVINKRYKLSTDNDKKIIYMKYNNKLWKEDEEKNITENSQYNDNYIFGPFDKIIMSNETAKDSVEDELFKSFIEKIIKDKKNLCIIGYGSSGAGKTSFLLKNTTTYEEGLLSHLCIKIGNNLKNKNKNKEPELKLNVTEYIYDEKTENKNENQLCITQNRCEDKLFKFSLNNWIDDENKNLINTVLELAENKRRIDTTLNNKESSRGHVIIKINFTEYGSLIICDFAGVENKFNCEDYETLKKFYENIVSKKNDIIENKRKGKKVNESINKDFNLDDELKKDYEKYLEINKKEKEDLKNFINDNIRIKTIQSLKNKNLIDETKTSETYNNLEENIKEIIKKHIQDKFIENSLIKLEEQNFNSDVDSTENLLYNVNINSLLIDIPEDLKKIKKINYNAPDEILSLYDKSKHIINIDNNSKYNNKLLKKIEEYENVDIIVNEKNKEIEKIKEEKIILEDSLKNVNIKDIYETYNNSNENKDEKDIYDIIESFNKSFNDEIKELTSKRQKEQNPQIKNSLNKTIEKFTKIKTDFKPLINNIKDNLKNKNFKSKYPEINIDYLESMLKNKIKGDNLINKLNNFIEFLKNNNNYCKASKSGFGPKYICFSNPQDKDTKNQYNIIKDSPATGRKNDYNGFFLDKIFYNDRTYIDLLPLLNKNNVIKSIPDKKKEKTYETISFNLFNDIFKEKTEEILKLNPVNNFTIEYVKLYYVYLVKGIISIVDKYTENENNYKNQINNKNTNINTIEKEIEKLEKSKNNLEEIATYINNYNLYIINSLYLHYKNLENYLKNIKEKITDKITKICDLRVKEGIVINSSLSELRNAIRNYLLEGKKDVVVPFVDICAPLQCNPYYEDCFGNINLKKDENNSDLLDIIKGNDSLDDYIFCIVNVINMSLNILNPPSPYFDLTELIKEKNRLQSIYKERIFISEEKNNEKEDNDIIANISMKPCISDYVLKDIENRLKEYSPERNIKGSYNKQDYDMLKSALESELNICKRISDITDKTLISSINNFIEKVNKLNSITPIGTMEYLDIMAKYGYQVNTCNFTSPENIRKYNESNNIQNINDTINMYEKFLKEMFENNKNSL